jgi:preprotein translocase subunit SecD
MKVCARQFNLYLALGTALALLGGCQTDSQKASHKKDKQVAALRIHIEVNADNAGDLSTAQTISVLRSTPVAVTIEQDPVLTEVNVLAAKVVELPGGFAVEVKFDETATWTLEQYSAANPGKHFAIFGQWGEKVADGRWLAAPLINHRIGDGVLAFTPDASREEADQLVLGLNNVAKKNHAGMLK